MSITHTQPPMVSCDRDIPRSAWPVVLGGTVLVVAALPLLVVHVHRLLALPHYQFLPLLALGSGVLAFLGVRRCRPLTAATPRAGLVPALIGWLLLALAELANSPWLAMVAFQVILLAVLLGVGGARLFRTTWPAWALLWLAVPPPFALDYHLVHWLQAQTAHWSSLILDYLGVYHVMAGNVVVIGGHRLLVEEACSGVNSLFSILACTLFYIFILHRPFLRSLLLVVAAIGWVLTANLARVVGIGYLETNLGFDLATGWRHEAFGMGLFVLALGLIWSTDQFLLFFASSTTAPAARPEASNFRLAQLRQAWFASAPALGFFAALPLFHLAWYGIDLSSVASVSLAPWVGPLNADSFPTRIDQWERQHYLTETRSMGSPYGEFSRTWIYRQGSREASLELDYPFAIYHDLKVCYRGQGWEMDEFLHRAEPEDSSLGGYWEVKMTQPGYRCGYLLFSQFDQHGTALVPRHTTVAEAMEHRPSALRSLWYWLHGGSEPVQAYADPPGPLYQYQVLVESYAPLTPVEEKEALALFIQGWKQLRERFLPKGPSALVPETRRKTVEEISPVLMNRARFQVHEDFPGKYHETFPHRGGAPC